MPGFCVSYPFVWEGIDLLDNTFYLNQLEHVGQFTCYRSTIKKFLNDKLFDIGDDYIIIQEGCLLNKISLMKKYGASDLRQLVLYMYNDGKNIDFFKDFIGPFCGAIYDKKANRWIVYTNQTGEKAVYYYNENNNYIFANNLNWIYDICKKNDISLNVDENGIYQLLTFGFMEDNSTISNEIKRLRGGSYILIENDSFLIKYYHSFSKNKDRFKNSSEKEIIDTVEKYFNKAISLEYDKDIEYGYNHIADMSGGLDSRMNVWAAHDMGYDNVQLLTYCRANYQDEIIAKEIASFWKDPLIVKPLDDLKFFYDIDLIVSNTGGTSVYSGITGGRRLLEILDWNRFGIEHTGLIGDALLGSFFHDQQDFEKKEYTGRFSEKLVNKLKNNNYKSQYDDIEIYLLYTRAIQGACNTVQIRNYFTETWSPFLDPDFFQVCIDIPVSLRTQHYIYKKWIETYHYEATRFRWESIDGLITESPLRIKLRKIIKRGPKALARKIGLKKESSNNGMNPLDFWLETDSSVSNYLNSYFYECEEKFHTIISEELREDMRWLFLNGNAMEKCMVVTAYGALKLMI